jgi:hypothetical protein
MQTDNIVELLIAERDRLTRAIDALQGPTKRRGRPPKQSLVIPTATVRADAAPAKNKRMFTAAQRKLQAERMKAYWKKRKAAEANQ